MKYWLETEILNLSAKNKKDLNLSGLTWDTVKRNIRRKRSVLPARFWLLDCYEVLQLLDLKHFLKNKVLDIELNKVLDIELGKKEKRKVSILPAYIY